MKRVSHHCFLEWVFIFTMAHIVSCWAQISISYTSMPGIGDTIRYSVASLSTVGNYTATGSNYVWDFSGLSLVTQGRRDFTNNTPYMFYFIYPKYGEKIADTIFFQSIPSYGQVAITDYYLFYRNTPSVFDVEGAGIKINNVPVPAFYSDKDELYFFPLQYGNKDSSTFQFSTPTTTAIPFVYKKQGYRITKVDGWGSIITPYGTHNCLRVVTTQYSKDTLIYESSFGPVKYGFNNYQRSYQWIGNNEKIPLLEVSGILSTSGIFTPNLVRYRDNCRVTGVKESEAIQPIKVYPNPSNGMFKIDNIFNDNIELFLYSLNGQCVMHIKEHSGFADVIDVDVSHLPDGKYYGFIYTRTQLYSFQIEVLK